MKEDMQTFNSVWDALADTPQEAANLRARAELIQQIQFIIMQNAWTQTQAASVCSITQPRINDLLQGKVSQFSLDSLINIATALGQRVSVHLEAA